MWNFNLKGNFPNSSPLEIQHLMCQVFLSFPRTRVLLAETEWSRLKWCVNWQFLDSSTLLIIKNSHISAGDLSACFINSSKDEWILTVPCWGYLVEKVNIIDKMSLFRSALFFSKLIFFLQVHRLQLCSHVPTRFAAWWFVEAVWGQGVTQAGIQAFPGAQS